MITLNVEQKQKSLEPYFNQKMTFIELPQNPYDELKENFKEAKHFSPIDDLQVQGTRGIYILAPTEEEGLKAAAYVVKKYIAAMEDDEWNDDDFVQDFIDGDRLNVPVIHAAELNGSNTANGFMWGQAATALNAQNDKEEPYWQELKFPKIVLDTSNNFYLIDQKLDSLSGFVIYVTTSSGSLDAHPFLPVSEKKNVTLFNLDYEVLNVSMPTEDYYIQQFGYVLSQLNYELHEDAQANKLVRNLKDFKNGKITDRDLTTYIKRAIRHKTIDDGWLREVDFHKALDLNLGQIQNIDDTVNTVPSARTRLHQLIGLERVKEDIERMVSRLKYEKQRKKMNLSSIPFHNALVFSGNPGTAKTVTARLLAQLLREEGLLGSDSFKEISRSDLIGQYVGWTAKQVERIFAENVNGVIFIDEAYSIFSDDPYSSEACAALILGLENNPGTLVIMAGYPDEMQHFVDHANPGLRSRITSVLHFEDYAKSEMIAIFHRMVADNNMALDDEEAADGELVYFLEHIQNVNHAGNGRLMRKLLNEAINRLSTRENHDFRTLCTEDIRAAIHHLLEMDNVSSSTSKEIGFRIARNHTRGHTG
ncbi:ATP-binding protein [Alicyclobacillus mengziensis]|uniref:AAA family ATPase n=1 Tax=Alicyclobacillus mengziensis TaxID=2931921 RepID=A0A9X7Z610_9BACL|nr:AAA family ATPase [Alicyclobacillus mengziensis]QSO47479.1 AAA family ATPase [Alicyclobacillus mengziensis]